MDVFLIEDGDLLEKYNTIWDKLNADFKKDFDSDPAYNKQFLKIKIKRHGDEDFYNTDIHKVDSNHTCLAVSAWTLVSRKMETVLHKWF